MGGEGFLEGAMLEQSLRERGTPERDAAGPQSEVMVPGRPEGERGHVLCV